MNYSKLTILSLCFYLSACGSLSFQKQLLVVGDSISIGYIPFITLPGIQAVAHVPGNAGNTAYGVNKISDWLGDDYYDVIIFNFGLHDFRDATPIPLEAYKANLRLISLAILQHTSHAFFISTSYVPFNEPNLHNIADPEMYRQIAFDVMTELNIPVIDVLATSATLPRIEPTNVHYTEEGYRSIGAFISKQMLLFLTRKCEL